MENIKLLFRVLKRISRIVVCCGNKIDFLAEYYRRYSSLSDRVKSIGGGYHGNRKEYKNVVLKYWKRFGIRPRRKWFALYCNGMDAYNPKFIPDSIWFQYILPYYNNLNLNYAYLDKSMLSRLLPDVKKPETIVKKTANYYYNGDKEELISREEAERICEYEEHLIIKPNNRSKGAGIEFYDRDEKSGKSITKIFDDMKGGFVVQRIVKQHPDLAQLNSSTLNTIRVISFHFKGEVHILSAQLRIGRAGARVDNVSAGGSACAVYPTGWLHAESVTRQSTWTDETPSGIKLQTIRVPNYEGIVETIKRLHEQLPYYDIIGWDFAVGEDGTPIMVEFNTEPGQNQIGGREPTFGDMTDEVLEDVFIKKTLKNAFKR